MAAGDTLHGLFRYVRVDAAGNREIILGPKSTREVDQSNVRDAYFVNAAPPGAANVEAVDHRPIMPGESLRIEFNVEASEAINSTHANALAGMNVSVLEKDLNTGRIYPKTLRVGDRTTSGTHGVADGATPTATAGQFTDVISWVPGDRKAWYLKGRQNARVVENA